MEISVDAVAISDQDYSHRHTERTVDAVPVYEFEDTSRWDQDTVNSVDVVLISANEGIDIQRYLFLLIVGL